MESYICINGKKTELTPEQIKALGIAPQRTLAEISNAFFKQSHPL